MSYSTATPANISTDPQPPLASPRRAAPEDVDQGRAAARELAVWLSALPSFLVLQNHPLGDDDLSRLAERNYIHEARILKQALRRCLHLSFVVGTQPRDGEADDVEPPRATLISHHETALTADTMRALRESLCEAYGACSALTEAKRIGQVAWSGVGGLTLRALSQDARRARATHAVPDGSLRWLLPEVYALLENCAPPTGDLERSGELAVALSQFACALDHLALVGAWLRDDRPLKMTLPIFAHVHERARAAVSSLESMARGAAEGKGGWYELCDGSAYAVRMEMNKVFRHELIGLAASRHPSTIFTKVENSYGLLRDCFQQTIISLARTLDTDFDGEQ
ncbi:MAG: hypothetical protein LC746_17145, partial [Acidobacteria bacterium]|nr:hypothetical protein [Acidobacteriota bacterium]